MKNSLEDSFEESIDGLNEELIEEFSDGVNELTIGGTCLMTCLE